jgi:hypothetical protein
MQDGNTPTESRVESISQATNKWFGQKRMTKKGMYEALSSFFQRKMI